MDRFITVIKNFSIRKNPKNKFTAEDLWQRNTIKKTKKQITHFGPRDEENSRKKKEKFFWANFHYCQWWSSQEFLFLHRRQNVLLAFAFSRFRCPSSSTSFWMQAKKTSQRPILWPTNKYWFDIRLVKLIKTRWWRCWCSFIGDHQLINSPFPCH